MWDDVNGHILAALTMGYQQRRNDLIHSKLLTVDGVSERVLQKQRLSGYADADRFHRAIRALINMHVIEPSPPGEAERPKMLRVPV